MKLTKFDNGEVRPISYQGEVAQRGVTIYAPQKGNRAAISCINITSDVDFEISLARYSGLTGQKALLYNLSLNAGSVIDDTRFYHLSEGDYLYLVAPSGAATWAIQGLEYEKNCLTPPFGAGGSLNVIDKNGNFNDGTTGLHPFVAVVGGSGDTPVAGDRYFTSTKLKGLGLTNNGYIWIMLDGTPMFSFGNAKSFDFNTFTGEIDLGVGNSFADGAGLYVDRNQ